jgi:8-oxo-dGTP pyrophosphatase MutT (NUDIX family)
MTEPRASCHTAPVPVKPAPATPSPAATLVLLRDRPAGGFDVLLIQRHQKSKFAAGDYVFPGGKIEPDDNPDDAARWCAGLDAERAARTLGLDPRGALGYFVGAVREAFEEVGILLAYGVDGAPVRLDDGRWADYRRACHADNRAFWDMVRAERLTVATDRLTYFAHWITPEENPYRYDTRFFVAETMPGQAAVADEHEIVDVRWLTPEEAFAARERGEISLRVPTMKNLALFEGGGRAADAIARVGARTVTTVRPRVVTENGVRRALLPGDPGWY